LRPFDVQAGADALAGQFDVVEVDGVGGQPLDPDEVGFPSLKPGGLFAVSVARRLGDQGTRVVEKSDEELAVAG